MKVSIEKERMLVQGLLRRRAGPYEWNIGCDTGLSYVTQIQRFRPVRRESKTHTEAYPEERLHKILLYIFSHVVSLILTEM